MSGIGGLGSPEHTYRLAETETGEVSPDTPPAEAGTEAAATDTDDTDEIVGEESWAGHVSDLHATVLAASLEAPSSTDSAGPAAVADGAAGDGAAQGAAGTEAPVLATASTTKPLLRLGSGGPHVRDLQEKLNDFQTRLGLPKIPADGDFGPGTRKTLIQFQRTHGLDADGVCGTGTWAKLLGEVNAERPDPRPGTLEANVLKHRQVILDAAKKTGVPAALLAGFVAKESSGRADVVGITGDRGLMQINPRAHPDFFKTKDWKSPKDSVEYGAQFIRRNLRSFTGDVERAVAAYNAGAGGVRKGVRKGLTLDQITYKPHYVGDVLKYAKQMAPYL
ncbi:transglycosylase SLT domain-containing protein [Planctomycetota bacterium]